VSQHGEAVVVGVIVVPLVAVRVDEEDVVGEIVVVVDDVAEGRASGQVYIHVGSYKRQVYHALSALVLGDCEWRVGVVYVIDVGLPRGKVVVEPGGILRGLTCDNDGGASRFGGYGYRVVQQLVGKMRQAEVGRGNVLVPKHTLQVHQQRREQEDVEHDDDIARCKAGHGLRHTIDAVVGNCCCAQQIEQRS
jgi:hypothetical protein